MEAIDSGFYPASQDGTQVPHEAPEGVGCQIMLRGHMLVYVVCRQAIDSAIPPEDLESHQFLKF